MGLEKKSSAAMFTLVLLSLLPPAIHASTSSLCRVVIGALSDPLVRTEARRINVARINAIIDTLLRHGGGEDLVARLRDLEFDDFYSALLHGEQPGVTFVNGGDGDVIFGSDRLSDTVQALHLPTTGESTVWNLLNSSERLMLAHRLQMIFRNGIYNSSASQNDANSRANVVLAAAGEGDEQRNVGFVPTRVFAAASRSCRSGECRFSNASLAGLLVELGIPKGDIRVMGSDTHAWLEFRSTSNSRWYVLDATGRSPEDPSWGPQKRALEDLAANVAGIAPTLPTVETAPRRMYPLNAQHNLFSLSPIVGNGQQIHGTLFRNEAGEFNHLHTSFRDLIASLTHVDEMGVRPTHLTIHDGELGSFLSDTTQVELLRRVLSQIQSIDIQHPAENAGPAIARLLSFLPSTFTSVTIKDANVVSIQALQSHSTFSSLRHLTVSSGDAQVLDSLLSRLPAQLESLNLHLDNFEKALPVIERHASSLRLIESLKFDAARVSAITIQSFLTATRFPGLKTLIVSSPTPEVLQALVQSGLADQLNEVRVRLSPVQQGVSPNMLAALTAVQQTGAQVVLRRPHFSSRLAEAAFLMYCRIHSIEVVNSFSR